MTIRSDSFAESATKPWSEERERLLRSRVDELGLTIGGTRLEPLVQQLYVELEQAGIALRPDVFLSDEWGCPEGIAAIGVPFYLADPRLSRLEKEVMEDIEAESDLEIIAYLRHEAGHAFNYAYRLHETEEWHEQFGPYSRPYREQYEPNPFSRNFVRHISHWYAQKHPDEDFAETFAVWLTPGGDDARAPRRVGRSAPSGASEEQPREPHSQRAGRLTRHRARYSRSIALRRVARLTGLSRCSSKPASRAFSFSPSSL